MIYIDDRVGSVDLIPYFKPFGVTVESTRLEFGDAAFSGNGPDGDVLIGVERKRINDLIQSMRNRRLSGHQLPGLTEGFDYVYLIVEGIYRPGKAGELEVLIGKDWRMSRTAIMYREIDSYLNSLAVRAGVIVLRSCGPFETATQTFSLYSWWQKKWAAHTAHNQIYAPLPVSRKELFCGSKVESTLVTKMAAQIPGIDRKAFKLGAFFGTPYTMVNAIPEHWRRAGLGKVLAERVYRQLRSK